MTTSSTSPNVTSTTNAETATDNPFVTLLQQVLSQSASGQSQPNVTINSNGNLNIIVTANLNIYFDINVDHVTASNLMENLGNIMQMVHDNNIHLGFLNNRCVKWLKKESFIINT